MKTFLTLLLLVLAFVLAERNVQAEDIWCFTCDYADGGNCSFDCNFSCSGCHYAGNWVYGASSTGQKRPLPRAGLTPHGLQLKMLVSLKTILFPHCRRTPAGHRGASR